MGRVTRRASVLRVESGVASRRADSLAVEEPLEIRVGGAAYQVTMRTPGDDVDLVHGLLHAEGVVAAADDVVTVRYCAGRGPDGLNTYNVVDVALRPGLALPAERARTTLTSSACGVCGATSVEQVHQHRRHVLDAAVRVPLALVAGAPDRLRAEQRAFARTGGLHAAGLFDAAGRLLCVREDVGRHNAVDKVVGWALRDGRVPVADGMVCVSGRASFELVQKAVLAGVPVLVAVSAPSSLAVDLAEAAGLTLVGFARGSTANVYSHPERIVVGEALPRLTG